MQYSPSALSTSAGASTIMAPHLPAAVEEIRRLEPQDPQVLVAGQAESAPARLFEEHSLDHAHGEIAHRRHDPGVALLHRERHGLYVEENHR